MGKRIEEFSDLKTELSKREEYVEQDAISLGKSKKEVKLFISYARANEVLYKKLKDNLISMLNASTNYKYKWMDDIEVITAGDDWHNKIQSAIKESHIGLFMISPEFLCSEYIKDHELIHFIKTDDLSSSGYKRAIPVGLKEIDIKRHLTEKLKKMQIFRLDRKKFFSELSSSDKQNKFALSLFEEIETFLDKNYDVLVVDKEEKSPKDKKGIAEKYLPIKDEMILNNIRSLAYGKESDEFVHSYGLHENINELVKEKEDKADKYLVQKFLIDWVEKKDSFPFCALLGEYGYGKTMNCLKFTRTLLEKRKEDKSIPLPIYLDLRYFKPKDKKFELNNILNEVIDKSYSYASEERISAKEVAKAVQDEGAVVIFDGLDEVLVHLTPDEANRFVQELWRILPVSEYELIIKGRSLDEDKRKLQKEFKGKMLISCRSHYFRNLTSQNSTLLGKHREFIRPEDYEALILLPFTQTQILEYFQKNLKDFDIKKAMEIIKSVHNLKDLSTRPRTHRCRRRSRHSRHPSAC